MDYNEAIVIKPWGSEWLLLGTPDVGVWRLSLKDGASTSLHSHPSKKTGLIVLDGTAEVHFMNGKQILRAGDKIMIRNGVFHRTCAIDGPLELIEVETPNDKLDLIRLEDAYGRSGEPYENESHYLPNDYKLDLVAGELMGQCQVRLLSLRNGELLGRPDAKIVVMEGKIFYKSYTVLGPGDVVDTNTLSRLAAKFEATELLVIEVRK